MREFTIFTDSSCDLSATMAQELGLTVLPLSVNIDGTSYENDLAGKALPFDTCYALLRAGKPATTSAVNVSQFVEAMEPVLQAGQDILYLGFSSALSGTYNAGAVACAQLAEKYPDAKLYAVDTLCASLGQGMLIYLAVQQKRAGKSIEEVRDYVEENKLHLCHWFTVDDLHHLRRGGRVSATSAVLGTMLVCANQNYTILQCIAFSLGSGLGYVFAVYIVREGRRRLRSKAVPSIFQGLPSSMIYIGVLSLAIYALVGHTVVL